MKEEEIDWLIYHQVASHDCVDIAELGRTNGLTEGVVEASLKRLERNTLIECRDKKAHALSINESLIRCQIKYDTSLPYTIENGMIKIKKRDGV